MRDLVVAVLIFGSVPFILRRPWFGIIVWTWIGFMNPHRMSWGFMTEFPVAYLVALTTLAGMLLSREPKKIPWTRETILLALFIAWMLITTLFALLPEQAWLQMEKVAKIQLMIFIAMMLITTRERLQLLVWTIVVSIGFYGVKGGIWTILHGGVHRVYGPPGTFIGGNNEIGLALAMTIPLAYYLYRETPRWLIRVPLAVSMVLIAIAALGTQSRGALVGMSAMGVMLWWKSRHKFFTALLVLLSVGIAYEVMSTQWFERMATIQSYQDDRSAQSRLLTWGMAYDMARDRFFGGGFQSFRIGFALYRPAYGGWHDAHSIYFEVLGEHGFVGLTLFLLLGLGTWMSASRIRRLTEKSKEMSWMAGLARMTQVSLIAYAAAGAFLGMAYFDYAYNLVLIVIICNSILASQRANEVATSGKEGQPAGQHLERGSPHNVRLPRGAY